MASVQILDVVARIDAVMGRKHVHRRREAEALLAEVAAWSEDEIKALPKFYREAARTYRRLANDGEG